MGVLRTIGIAFGILFLLFIVNLIIIGLVFLLTFHLGASGGNNNTSPPPVTITNTTTQSPQPQPPPNPNPILATGQPAGIAYTGPRTTAIAGYYCIAKADIANNGWIVNGTYQPNQDAYAPPGYDIQLNAQLSNGLWLQDVYGSYYTWEGSPSNVVSINVGAEVWNGQQELLNNMGPAGQPCGWLVISIKNGTAYFGYSSDGINVTWYASYPVGNTTIVPTLWQSTNIVIAGPGNSAGVNFTSLYATLALYYWNGTTWVPAPVVDVNTNGGTAEFVVYAWVYSHGNVAIVSWPTPYNETPIVPAPFFRP